MTSSSDDLQIKLDNTLRRGKALFQITILLLIFCSIDRAFFFVFQNVLIPLNLLENTLVLSSYILSLFVYCFVSLSLIRSIMDYKQSNHKNLDIKLSKIWKIQIVLTSVCLALYSVTSLVIFM